MSKILQDISAPTLSEAIEANLAEEMACFGRSLPGAILYEDPELQWFFTGLSEPHLNGVLYTRFLKEDKDYINAKILATLNAIKARKLPVQWSWSVGPSAYPSNLAQHLETHGFTYKAVTTGMAMDIPSIPHDISIPKGLIIKEVKDRETLRLVKPIEIKGFDSSEETAQTYYDVYAHSGFGPGKPWHHYIGWLNDQPVAISSLLLHAGVAGIFGIATIPEVRRKGIATAMTVHTINEARALGYRVAILTPTEMSLGIYHRLGFQKRCQVRHYGLALKNE